MDKYSPSALKALHEHVQELRLREYTRALAEYKKDPDKRENVTVLEEAKRRLDLLQVETPQEIQEKIDENYIEFACTIARAQAQRYRSAYREWVKDPSRINANKVRKAERDLRLSPVLVSDGEIMTIRVRVERELASSTLSNPGS